MDLAPCIAECHHSNEGVQCQAWYDVGKVHRVRKVRKIQCAAVHGLHLVVIGQACNDEFVGKLYIGDGGAGDEEVTHCAKSKMAHLLMVSMLMLIVRRRVAAARAYGWVGAGQEGNIIWFRFILLILSAPACQKLLYQP